MGILNFLKNLGNKKPEPIAEVEEISLQDLEGKLENWSKARLDNKQPELERLKAEIEKEKLVLQENLASLENAELKNKELPERAKQIMAGNKEIFLQKTSALIPKVSPPENPSELLGFTKTFDKTMEEFSKSVAKSHNVTSEFLAKETGLISVNIKKIDELVKRIKTTIESSQIDKLVELKEKLKQTQQEINQKGQLQKEIESKNIELSSDKNKIRENENKIEQLKQEEEYKTFLALQIEKQQIEKTIDDDKNQLSSSFSEIEAGLKRYANLNKEDKLAKGYLENSSVALNKDENLQVSQLIQKIKTYIKEGSIELNNKKKNKVLKGIDKLNEEYFKKFLTQSENANIKLNEVKEKLGKIKVNKEISELKIELTKIEEESKTRRTIIEKKTKELNGIDTTNLKKSLESEIKDKINETIIIN